jgi:hypothetical protein
LQNGNPPCPWLQELENGDGTKEENGFTEEQDELPDNTESSDNKTTTADSCLASNWKVRTETLFSIFYRPKFADGQAECSSSRRQFQTHSTYGGVIKTIVDKALLLTK